MQAMMRLVSVAIVIGVALSEAAALESGTFQVAQASCTATYNTCVARCRRDVPKDLACPSDHCVPKLASCKSSGCWQEGQRYGGKLMCNLKRS